MNKSDEIAKIALIAVACNVVVGFLLYPVAFFWSYAFGDQVTAGQHTTFLFGVLISLTIATLALNPIAARVLQVPQSRTLVGSLFASAAGCSTTASATGYLAARTLPHGKTSA